MTVCAVEQDFVNNVASERDLGNMADSVQKRQQRYLKATFIWHRKKNNPEYTHTLKVKLDRILQEVVCFCVVLSIIHLFYLHLQIVNRYKDISNDKYRSGSKNSYRIRKK